MREPQQIVIDVRMGVTLVKFPNGEMRRIFHDDPQVVGINITAEVPQMDDHPEAETATAPWQPMERAARYYHGKPVPEQEGSETWKNNLYTVTKTIHTWHLEDQEGPQVVHLSIRRNDRHWARDWRHFQKIKNDLVGTENEGVELYPAESRMVDQANQWHIWVLADPAGRWPVGYEDGRVVMGQDWLNIGGKQRQFSDDEEETVSPTVVASVVANYLQDADPALLESMRQAGKLPPAMSDEVQTDVET